MSSSYELIFYARSIKYIDRRPLVLTVWIDVQRWPKDGGPSGLRSTDISWLLELALSFTVPNLFPMQYFLKLGVTLPHPSGRLRSLQFFVDFPISQDLCRRRDAKIHPVASVLHHYRKGIRSRSLHLPLPGFL